MPDLNHAKLNHQSVTLIDMSLHAKNLHYTSNSFWDKFRNPAIDWPKAFLHLTRGPYFSQTCGFNRIIKVIKVHDLNPKKYTHRWTIFFWEKKKHIFWVILGIIPRMKYSPKSSSVSFLSLRHPNFMRSSENPTSRFGENTFTYWHTDSGEIIGPHFA